MVFIVKIMPDPSYGAMMDKQERWLIYDPLAGCEDQINALYAERMGDPSAFMVLSPDLASGFGITMVDRWKFNRFPIHEIHNGSNMDAHTLYCKVRVFIERPEWFSKFLSLDEAKEKLIEIGLATVVDFKSWARPTLIINPEYEASARAESFFF